MNGSTACSLVLNTASLVFQDTGVPDETLGSSSWELLGHKHAR